jgi:hypothetical protein
MKNITLFIHISLITIVFFGIVLIYDFIIKKRVFNFLGNCKESAYKSDNSKTVKTIFNMFIDVVGDPNYPALMLFYKLTVEKEIKSTGDFIIKKYQFLIK